MGTQKNRLNETVLLCTQNIVKIYGAENINPFSLKNFSHFDLWYFVCFSTTASLLRNNRYRRDQRTLEEEEEMWFSNDDEVDDGENMVPMSDVLKNKIDADFDQINRLLENRRGTNCQYSKKD